MKDLEEKLKTARERADFARTNFMVAVRDADPQYEKFKTAYTLASDRVYEIRKRQIRSRGKKYE